MNVHEELALDVFRGESTKAEAALLANIHMSIGPDILDFIEYNTGGLGYPEQAHNTCNSCQKTQELPVGARQTEDVMVLHTLRLVAHDWLRLLLLLLCTRGGRSCWGARGGFA